MILTRSCSGDVRASIVCSGVGLRPRVKSTCMTDDGKDFWCAGGAAAANAQGAHVAGCFGCPAGTTWRPELNYCVEAPDYPQKKGAYGWSCPMTHPLMKKAGSSAVVKVVSVSRHPQEVLHTKKPRTKLKIGCGMRGFHFLPGKISKGNVGTDSKVTTMYACGTKCKKNSKCVSFFYNLQSRLCFLTTSMRSSGSGGPNGRFCLFLTRMSKDKRLMAPPKKAHPKSFAETAGETSTETVGEEEKGTSL